MKKVKYLLVLLLIILVMFVMVGCGKKDNEQGGQTSTDNNEITEEEFFDGYRIIYGMDKVPEQVLKGYEQGYENYDMNNQYVLENRAQNVLGKQSSNLQVPQVQYDVYTKLNDNYYIFTINKGGWLYTRGIGTINEQSDISLYVLQNSLSFREIKISFEQISDMRKSKTSDETLKSKGWTSTDYNGWTVYTPNDDVTNYAVLYNFIDDELVMQTNLYKTDRTGETYMSNEEFEEFIKKFTDSVYITKQTDEKIDKKIEIKTDLETITLEDGWSITPLKDTYIVGWAYNVDNKQLVGREVVYALLLFTNDNTKAYRIQECVEDATLDDIKNYRSDSFSYIPYTSKQGISVEIIQFTYRGNNTYSGFFVKIGDKYYKVDFAGEDIYSLEEAKQDVEYVLTNILHKN